MTIQLNHHYGVFPAGSIVSSFGDGVVAELIRRGIAVEVKEKSISAPPQNKSLTADRVKNKGAK
jgi:hypothetical protein